jgi:hypothetical protein
VLSFIPVFFQMLGFFTHPSGAWGSSNSVPILI